jgi:hypothetical protein
MRREGRKGITVFAIGSILAFSLACNLPTPSEPPISTPEVQIVVVTATGAGEEAAQPTATSLNTGGGPTLPVDTDITASVSIKGGTATYEGSISFPGTDDSDEIYIKPVGFDSTATSGSLLFTLNCAGEGNAKVNYKGGAVTSGSPGCGEAWTVSVVTGSADSHITIRLDDRGEVDWTLSVTSGE